MDRGRGYLPSDRTWTRRVRPLEPPRATTRHPALGRKDCRTPASASSWNRLRVVPRATKDSPIRAVDVVVQHLEDRLVAIRSKLRAVQVIRGAVVDVTANHCSNVDGPEPAHDEGLPGAETARMPMPPR